MAERIAYLEAVIGADITQFRKAMRDIRNDMGVMAETSSSSLATIGRTATYALSVPLAAAGTAAITMASNFESSLYNINSIMHMTQGELDNLGAKVLELGSKSRYGANAAAEAIYDIFSAGISNATQATDLLTQSIAVAEAGQADLMSTTRGLTAVMLAYAGTGTTVEEIANATTRAIAVGVGSQEDYNRNIQKTLPLARALSIEYEDLAANIAVVSQNGSGLSKAETAVAMAMSNLLKPTNAMKAAFKDLGVTTGGELVTKFGGLTEAIMALRENADSPIDFNAMFSKTGLEAAFTLTNNIEETRKRLDEFGNGLDTAVTDARTEQLKSFAAQWDLLKASLEGAGIVIGQVLIPAVTPLVQGITDLFTQIRQLNPDLLQLGVALGAAVTFGAPLIWLLGSLMSPIGLLIGGVAALGAIFVTNFDTIKATVENVVSAVFGDLTTLKDLVAEFTGIVFPEPKAPEKTPEEVFGDWTGDLAATLRGLKTTVPLEDVIVVEPGDSLWSIWAENYKDTTSFDDFVASLDLPAANQQLKEAITSELSGAADITMDDLINFEGDNADILLAAANVFGNGNLNSALQTMLDGELTGSNSIIIRPGDIIRFSDGGGTGDGKQTIGNALLDMLAGGLDIFSSTPKEVPEIALNLQGIALEMGAAEQSIFDRLAAAFSAVAPRLLAELGRLFLIGAQWADEQIGKGLDWLAGLFQAGDSTGNSPVYNAVKELLEGDLWGAIDAVIPGLGTKIGDSLSEALGLSGETDFTSKAAEAAGNLIGAIANWIVTEGAPTIARSLGYAIGRAGSAIGQGINALFSGSGGVGGGLGDAAGNLLDFGANLGGTFVEGFQEGAGAGGADTSNLGQVILTALAGALAVQFSISAIMSAFSGAGVLTALGTGMTAAFATVKIGANAASKIIDTLAGGFTQAAMQPLANKIGSALWGATGTYSWGNIGTAIQMYVLKGLNTAFGTAFTSFTAIGKSLAGWIVSGITSILTSPITIGIAIGFAVDSIIPEETKAQLRALWANFYDSVAGEGAAQGADAAFQQTIQDIIREAMGLDNLTFGGKDEDTARAFVGQYFSGLLQQMTTVSPDGSITIDLTNIDMAAQMSGMETDAFKNLLTAQLMADMMSAPVELKDDIARMIAAIQGEVVTAAGEAKAAEGVGNTIISTITKSVQDAITALTTGEGGDKPTINPMNMIKLLSDEGIDTGGTILKPEDIVPSAEAMTVAMENMSAPFNTAFDNMVVTVGSLDPELVNTNYLLPMQEAFIATFGEASVTRAAVVGFFDMMTQKAQTGSAELIQYGIANIGAGITMVTTWSSSVAIVQVVLQKWIDKLQTAIRMIQTLRAEAAKPITITVGYDFLGMGAGNPGEGTLGVDGSHALGLPKVPYDGYIAELHKGERVLTAAEARALDDRYSTPMTADRAIVQQQQAPQASVNVYGVQSVDDFIRELRRRGYSLGR